MPDPNCNPAATTTLPPLRPFGGEAARYDPYPDPLVVELFGRVKALLDLGLDDDAVRRVVSLLAGLCGADPAAGVTPQGIVWAVRQLRDDEWCAAEQQAYQATQAEAAQQGGERP